MPSPLQVVNVDCNFTYDLEQQRIQAAGAELILRTARTEDEIIASCANAAIILLENADTPLTARVIDALPECRAIIRYGVGVDSIDVPAATRKGVIVANAADFCTEEVSDHAVALLLASVKRIAYFDRRLRAGGWHDFTLAPPLRRVSSLTLGLIGWGRIAQAVARKMQGFRLRILTTDPYVSSLPDDCGVELVTHDQLLRESDLISLHLPLNAQTKHLIGEEAFQTMKSTAFLINTSRGGVVDEAALVHALEQNYIGGAALDVMETEPLSAASPLRTIEQVTLTPHYAASSQESMEHLHASVTASVEAIIQGYWPPFPVNPAVQPSIPLRPWADFQQNP